MSNANSCIRCVQLLLIGKCPKQRLRFLDDELPKHIFKPFWKALGSLWGPCWMCLGELWRALESNKCRLWTYVGLFAVIVLHFVIHFNAFLFHAFFERCVRTAYGTFRWSLSSSRRGKMSFASDIIQITVFHRFTSLGCLEGSWGGLGMVVERFSGVLGPS